MRNEIEFDEINLTQLHNSTIEWNRYRTDLNFTDREIMDTLDNLLFSGKTPHEILNHLQKL